jgi:hypothetical protein
MDNTAWKHGGDVDPQAAAAPNAALRRRLPARLSPRYCVVLALRGVAQAADVIRSIVGTNRGELEWLSGNQLGHATRMHIRLRAERIYDIVTAFEAAGFDVIRVVTTGR